MQVHVFTFNYVRSSVWLKHFIKSYAWSAASDWWDRVRICKFSNCHLNRSCFIICKTPLEQVLAYGETYVSSPCFIMCNKTQHDSYNLLLSMHLEVNCYSVKRLKCQISRQEFDSIFIQKINILIQIRVNKNWIQST